MSNHPHYDALREIESLDPDGDETRTSPPTAVDYARHRTWAIGTYGADVWRIYRTEPWGLFGTDPV